MPKSLINPKYEYDEKIWVISIVNTRSNSSSRSIFGHAMIIIEGMDKRPNALLSTPFLSHYDITGVIIDNHDSRINPKGHIEEIRCTEWLDIPLRHAREDSPSISIYASSEAAKATIKSIKEDKKICDDAKKGKGEFLPYQKVGENSLFTELGMGHNCASWCTAKLKDGGIMDINDRKKPPLPCTII